MSSLFDKSHRRISAPMFHGVCINKKSWYRVIISDSHPQQKPHGNRRRKSSNIRYPIHPSIHPASATPKPARDILCQPYPASLEMPSNPRPLQERQALCAHAKPHLHDRQSTSRQKSQHHTPPPRNTPPPCLPLPPTSLPLRRSPTGIRIGRRFLQTIQQHRTLLGRQH